GAGGTVPPGTGGASSSTGGSVATGSGGVSQGSTGGTTTGGAPGSGGTASGGAPGSGGAAGSPMVDVGSGGGGGGDPRVLLSVLSKFTAADVPVMGPMEAAPMPRNYTGSVPTRPGNGLAQHPMLYVGENYDRILLTNGGKVIWTYDTKGGYELDDIWLLSNGNVLYSHMTYIEEVTPAKQVVWHYVPPSGEIHTCQPIGLDKVLIGLNQNPTPRLELINKKTMMIEMDHALPDGSSNVVHTQMRRMRLTAAGTYLVGFLDKGKVVEYDSAWNPVWTFATSRPWSVARLHNGNTLIQDESESTCKEVDSKGTVVWSYKKSEIAVPGATVGGNTQSCERLASGNTVMLLHSGAGQLQAVEVTKAKQIVWALEDWKDLGDATSAQFLDEPGISEVPGSTEH
ncbi:MAG: hypothetical protein ABUS79_23655, partial [Pseudomonadota bacterium]